MSKTTKILNFLENQLSELDSYIEIISLKYLMSISLSIIFSFISVVLSYFFDFFKDAMTIAFKDRNFLLIIFILIFSDTVSGVIKHWKLKSLDKWDFIIKLTLKITICTLAMISFNAFSSFEDIETLGKWVDVFGKLTIFIFILISILENFYVISEGEYPPKAFMDRFTNFNKTLSINDLIKKEENEK